MKKPKLLKPRILKPRGGWYGDPLRHSLAARGQKTSANAKIQIKSLDEIIIDELTIARRPLSTKQISKGTGLAWVTVKKCIKELEKENKIKKTESKSRAYWHI